MKRILVTGSTGQIGTYVVERLVAQGHEVLGTLAPDGLPLPAGVAPCGRLFAAEDVPSVLAAAGRLDAVIHLAGQSSVAASWKAPLETFDVNARLATAMVYEVAKHEGLVHASSAEIFGAASAPV